MNPIHATPFHAGAAQANRFNRWTVRNGFTLAQSYVDPGREALAARFGVIVADISWRWRLMLEGGRAVECARRLFTRDAGALAPGEALKALWLSDGGGVRGAGLVARYGRQSFLLASAAPDVQWFAASAALFGVAPRDLTQDEGGLAIVGPFAAHLIADLGLDATLAPLAFRKLFWRGLDITLSRFGEHGGFELWCRAEDGPLVWDRVLAAGAPYTIQPAGLEAMDILDIEAGIARPGRDYDGAQSHADTRPSAAALRLQSLIDPAHEGFNGKAGASAAASETLVGILFDGDVPAPFTPLLRGGTVAGRTLGSCHSPALKRAIALAQVGTAHAATGTALTLTPPSSRETPFPSPVNVRVADLPFLPIPVSLAP